MGTYRSFDKNKCMKVLIKKIFLINLMKFGKVSNKTKKLIVILCSKIKRYLKDEGTNNTKEGF